MHRTYLSALEDAHHGREIEGGQLVRLPAGFVAPGCDVYDAIAREAQAEVARVAAAGQAAREAEQAARRAAREQERKAARAARARHAQQQRRNAEARSLAQDGAARQTARDHRGATAPGAAAISEGTAGDRPDLQRLLDVIEAERGLRPAETGSAKTGPDPVSGSSLDAATRRAIESADKLRRSMEAAAAARAEYAARETRGNSRDGGPASADLRRGFLRALHAVYPERDCMDGFRSTLMAFPNIEICAHYIRFDGTCDKMGPNSFDCTLSFRITVTSPTHPDLTPQLQRNNRDHTIAGFLFTKTDAGWIRDATDPDVHEMVPTEFRHRDPF